MLKNVVDTHRLMYRNARIKAIDLSDRTTQIPFFNITDQIVPDEDIGYEVYTDAAGYLYYGANAQPIQCLAVKKSAIIQVDLTGNGAWDIEWVLRSESEDEYVKVDDVHKAYYADGTLAWDPLVDDWHLPDFALRSEIGRGEWAEGEMIVTEETPLDLNIDKWTHVITFRNGHADTYRMLYTKGRYGQTIRLLNISDTDVTVITQHKVNANIYNTRVLIKAGYCTEATYTDHVGWYATEPYYNTSTDYTIDAVGAWNICDVNLADNPSVSRIIYQPDNAPNLALICLKDWDGGEPILEIVNKTDKPVRVGAVSRQVDNTYTGVGFTEIVLPKNTLRVTVYRPSVSSLVAVRACDGTRSAYVTNDEIDTIAATEIENCNIHVYHAPTIFYGTVKIPDDMPYGQLIPIRILSTEGSHEGTAIETLTLAIGDDGPTTTISETLNHIKNTSGSGSKHLDADVELIYLSIRRWRLNEASPDQYDITLHGGAML